MRTVVLEQVAAQQTFGGVSKAKRRTALALADDFGGITDDEGRLVAMSDRVRTSPCS